MAVALVVAAAFACQWVAWRTRVPALLFLLAVGFAAQPFFAPYGESTAEFTAGFVPVAAGLILFEGGLNLQLQDLAKFARPMRGLISIGILLTWFLAAGTAYLLTPVGPSIAAVLGAILVVTGPTVVGPLFRHLRVKGSSGLILQFEGVLNDPVGAVLAIITFQVVQTGEFREALPIAVFGVVKSAVVGVSLGGVTALALTSALRRSLIPTYLEGLSSIAAVLCVQTLANIAQPEAGLLAVTVLGVVMASQPTISTHELRRFHEDLQVLLVGVLFILLIGQMDTDRLLSLTPGSILWILGLILLVRPIAVFSSLWGSDVEFRERILIASVAPRGVVAAAVASVFTLQLEGQGLKGAELFLPLTIAVVASTVVIYSVSTPFLARWLGLTDPNPQGLAILGIQPFSCGLASALKDSGLRALLLDEDYRQVLRARGDGFEAEYVKLPSEADLDALDLSGIGHFMSTTDREELNAIAALQFRERFDDQCYQLRLVEGGSETPKHLRARYVHGVTRPEVIQRLRAGGAVKLTRLSEDFGLEAFREKNEGAWLIAVIHANGRLQIPTHEEMTGQPSSVIWIAAPPQLLSA